MARTSLQNLKLYLQLCSTDSDDRMHEGPGRAERSHVLNTFSLRLLVTNIQMQ
jgi:hypothetical protein